MRDIFEINEIKEKDPRMDSSLEKGIENMGRQIKKAYNDYWNEPDTNEYQEKFFRLIVLICNENPQVFIKHLNYFSKQVPFLESNALLDHSLDNKATHQRYYSAEALDKLLGILKNQEKKLNLLERKIENNQEMINNGKKKGSQNRLMKSLCLCGMGALAIALAMKRQVLSDVDQLGDGVGSSMNDSSITRNIFFAISVSSVAGAGYVYARKKEKRKEKNINLNGDIEKLKNYIIKIKSYIDLNQSHRTSPSP